MAKYTNKFKIDISPRFDAKYKILGYKRANCEKSFFYSKPILLESKYKELVISSYIYSSKVFFLFEKDCDTRSFESEDMSNFEKIYVNNERPWFKNLVKYNLIINSLEKKNKSNFSNVSGELFKFVSQTKNEIITLKISVVYDSTICLNVCTFTRLNCLKGESLKNVDKKTKYIFDGNTLSIANRNAKNSELFVRKKNEYSNHNVITFFDMCDQNKFYNSKMGVLLSFLEDVKKYLNDDITISFIPSNFDTEKLEIKKLGKKNKKLFQYIAEDKINIVNKSQNDLSKELKNLLEYKFGNLNLSPIIKISKKIIKDKINIVIVDTKEEYKSRGEKDKHQSSLDVVIQNVYPSTIQEELKKLDLSENAKLPAIKKLIFEIAIKKDIVNRTTNLAKMYGLDIPNWIFIQKEKNKFYQLCNSNNELVFSEYNNSIDSNYNINKFIKIDDKIIKIEETSMTPIPDLLFYKERLEKLNKETDVDKQVLINALNEYKFKHSSKKSDIDEIINNINGLIGRKVNKDEIYRCFKLSNGQTSRELGTFNDFFFNKYDILLNLNIKRNKYLEKFMSGFISLQYKKDKYNNYLYYIGKDDYSDFTTKIQQGIVITKINNISDNDFQVYRSLLKVDFIKINTGSKYPFPFKYLREYINIICEKTNLKKV